MVARRGVLVESACPACGRPTPHLQLDGLECRVCGRSRPDGLTGGDLPSTVRVWRAAALAVLAGVVVCGLLLAAGEVVRVSFGRRT